ncbi:hypothetical protein [Pontivivens nitratireducens]|uniref:Uncharacterized protein n=1 Tax=Pontivivens nitratireducens TaxID=2758038 RepID=A0A6G7VLK1_9RHOB|nr:hypothetical protein [Pontibrevibacter nitratireducens]QIK40919.1 hypothetical protein G8E03_09160 [Pontibrevibacter nitratireducens]
MGNGEDDAGRSVKDVLAAIRARVQADEAGLSARPDDRTPPLRLGEAQQVDDSDIVQPLRREPDAPLRLDTPVDRPSDVPPLPLTTPVQDTAPLRLQPSAPATEVPEAPHMHVEDEPEGEAGDGTGATITPLFASQPEAMTIDATEAERATSEVIEELRDEPRVESVEQVVTPHDDGQDDSHSTPTQEERAETGPPNAAEYDVWSPAPDMPPSEYDVWSPDPFAEPLPDPVEIAAASSSDTELDAEAIRAIVREELSGRTNADSSHLRGEIRAIVAEELESALGPDFPRSLRKSLRKDIVRALKERGLN